LFLAPHTTNLSNIITAYNWKMRFKYNVMHVSYKTELWSSFPGWGLIQLILAWRSLALYVIG